MDAFILRTIDYQEHSKLVYFYTSEGIGSAIARGVKKMEHPFKRFIQANRFVDLSLSKGKLPTIKEASSVLKLDHIREDLIKQTIVSVIAELIYKNVSPDDDHPKLLGFLKKTLTELDETQVPYEILMVFELKFLHFLGYGLGFQRCHVCQTTAHLYFSPYTGMTACLEHAEDIQQSLSEKAYAPLKYFLYVDLLKFTPQMIDRETISRYTNVIDGLYLHYLGFKAKSKAILHTLS